MIVQKLQVDNLETLVLINSISQKKLEMVVGHFDSIKIKLGEVLSQNSTEDQFFSYINTSILQQKSKDMIKKGGLDKNKLYALLISQSDELDVQSIRICARYNIQDIDICINKFLKNNQNKVSQLAIQQMILNDMRQKNYQEGVYMIYLSLKQQEIKQDIIFLYSLPLSYYFDYLLNHPQEFKFIHREFIVLVTQFAPILCQTHLTFKRNSILKEYFLFYFIYFFIYLNLIYIQRIKLDEEILNKYTDLMQSSQNEFKKIIENKKTWFSLFGISMAQVSAMTLKWFVNESIGQRNIKLDGCSDPMYFLLIKKKYFQIEDQLELLLCCIEVMIKNWEIYTDAYRISNKEKQLNYTFQLVNYNLFNFYNAIILFCVFI